MKTQTIGMRLEMLSQQIIKLIDNIEALAVRCICRYNNVYNEAQTHTLAHTPAWVSKRHNCLLCLHTFVHMYVHILFFRKQLTILVLS